MRNIDYMTTRPGHEHEHRISRDMITSEGRINLQAHPEAREKLEKDLTEAKEKYIYHLVLSSGDAAMSPKQTELWAKAILQSQGFDKYYMVIHAGEQGHTKNPHAHVIVRTDARLGKEEFFDMRKTGDLEQQTYRQIYRELEGTFKEKFISKPGSGSGGVEQVEEDEKRGSKKVGIDIQLG